MVSGEEKPSLLEASCCIELVVNGAGACDFAIAFFTLETIYSPFSSSIFMLGMSAESAGARGGNSGAMSVKVSSRISLTR